jgi:diguanylate cyclase (GGDEF)-like protein
MLILILFSSIQKLSMGVNPLLLKGFLMPIIIGGGIGFLTGVLLNKNNLLVSQLKSTNTMLEQQVKERTIELIKKNDELEKLSNTDALTNLSNRRHLDSILHMECRRLSRIHSELSLILCDIDYFKQYNDNYGHQAGDDCLKQIAKVMSSNLCRCTDFIARYGGEEFIIILPDTNLEVAANLAEKMRLLIEKMDIQNADFNTSVTMSFGVATVSSSQSTLIQESSLIAKADRALYAAKHKGRNTVFTDTN